MSDESPHAESVKTPEEIKAQEEKARKEKEKRFYENPDSFVEAKDLIVATINAPQGVLTFVGKGVQRHKLEISQSRLNHVIAQEFMRIEVEAFKKTQMGKRILTPKAKGAFGNPFKRK